MLWDKRGFQKGKRAELLFQKWLDNHNLPFLYIQQDINTISKSFLYLFKAKRPDFLIFLPNKNTLLVDIKNKNKTTKYEDLPIDSEELNRYINFEKEFKIPIWYAVSNEETNYQKWYWIKASKILAGIMNHQIPTLVSSKSNMSYHPVPLSLFTIINVEDNLDKLFKN